MHSFVTNPKMTREITAFPSPLYEAEVDVKAIEGKRKFETFACAEPELYIHTL